jgi:hypothetical protein
MIGVVIMNKQLQTNATKTKSFDNQTITTWLAEDGFNTSNEQDEGIVVITDSGIKLVIQIDVKRNFIKYYCIFSFKPDQDEVQKLRLVNELNAKVVFSRFSMPKPEILVSDYFVFNKARISKKNLIQSLRFFETVTINAIRQHDKNDLVQ